MFGMPWLPLEGELLRCPCATEGVSFSIKPFLMFFNSKNSPYS